MFIKVHAPTHISSSGRDMKWDHDCTTSLQSNLNHTQVQTTSTIHMCALYIWDLGCKKEPKTYVFETFQENDLCVEMHG